MNQEEAKHPILAEIVRVRVGVFLLGFFLLVMGVGLVVALFGLWPAVEASARPNPSSTSWRFLGLRPWALTPDTALLLLVAVVGGLGSLIHGATSFTTYVGNQRLRLSWCWWYVLRIPTGATLAVLMYFVLRGGLLTGSATTAAVNPYGIAAVAGLAGLFSKQAVDKLREVFDTLLRVRQGAGDDQRADKIDSPVPVLYAIEPGTTPAGGTGVELAVHGTAFDDDSRVLVRQQPGTGQAATEPVELTPVKAEADLLRVVLPDALTATAGTIDIAVVNPPPGGGLSAWLTMTVE